MSKLVTRDLKASFSTWRFFNVEQTHLGQHQRNLEILYTQSWPTLMETDVIFEVICESVCSFHWKWPLNIFLCLLSKANWNSLWPLCGLWKGEVGTENKSFRALTHIPVYKSTVNNHIFIYVISRTALWPQVWFWTKQNIVASGIYCCVWTSSTYSHWWWDVLSQHRCLQPDPSEANGNHSDSLEAYHLQNTLACSKVGHYLAVVLRVNWSIKIPAALLQLKAAPTVSNQPVSMSMSETSRVLV